jgi:putative SOS response-associated peptidase YedK
MTSAKAGEDWFCFAGLWRPMPEGGSLRATDEAGPDVAPIHDPQMVVLERSDWQAWFELTGNEADLSRPLPSGSLRVEQVH